MKCVKCDGSLKYGLCSGCNKKNLLFHEEGNKCRAIVMYYCAECAMVPFPLCGECKDNHMMCWCCQKDILLDAGYFSEADNVLLTFRKSLRDFIEDRKN